MEDKDYIRTLQQVLKYFYISFVPINWLITRREFLERQESISLLFERGQLFLLLSKECTIRCNHYLDSGYPVLIELHNLINLLSRKQIINTSIINVPIYINFNDPFYNPEGDRGIMKVVAYNKAAELLEEFRPMFPILVESILSKWI